MGEMPYWYPLAAASRYWGVPPWEMGDQSSMWIVWAEAMSRAEAHAEEMAHKHG